MIEREERAGITLGRVLEGLEAATPQDERAVREALNGVEVMAREDHARAAITLRRDQSTDAINPLTIEAGEGLIEQ